MTLSRVISKPLTRNDLGLTGSHQAGMCIPRKAATFFPILNESEKNPRTDISVVDCNNVTWSFNFIHYNNKLFGGTRYEYRLTKMTRFFREHGLKEKDRVEFKLDAANRYSILVHRHQESEGTVPTIRLGNRIVTIEDWEVLT